MSRTIGCHVDVGRGEPSHGRTLDVALLAGMAGVFLTNALVAWLQPDDFVNLVRRSVLGTASPVAPGRWLAWLIFANDLALGLVLATSIWKRRWRAAVLAWSGAWLLAVTAIKLTSLDVVAG